MPINNMQVKEYGCS
jgi:hypothetical protein